jgi:hypothetical protein
LGHLTAQPPDFLDRFLVQFFIPGDFLVEPCLNPPERIFPRSEKKYLRQIVEDILQVVHNETRLTPSERSAHLNVASTSVWSLARFLGEVNDDVRRLQVFPIFGRESLILECW